MKYSSWTLSQALVRMNISSLYFSTSASPGLPYNFLYHHTSLSALLMQYRTRATLKPGTVYGLARPEFPERSSGIIEHPTGVLGKITSSSLFHACDKMIISSVPFSLVCLGNCGR